MTRHRRTLTILTSGALISALAVTALAAPASAAKKPKCMGHKATIVGTARADVLKGTAKRDVIVAKAGNDIIVGRGGNDIICAGPGNDRVAGQAGHDRIAGQTGVDRLFGGGGVDTLMGNAGDDFLAGQAGPDILAGGVGNDKLDGGIGVDTCLQNSGSGVKVRCELPAEPAPIPLTGILAIAYSDIDGLDGYSTGDALIAKLLDTNGDGKPSGPSGGVPGDTIKMGVYPTKLAPTTADFGDWKEQTHMVATVIVPEADAIRVQSTSGGHHEWYEAGGSYIDMYYEHDGLDQSSFQDNPANGAVDAVRADAGSPSQPRIPIPYTPGSSSGDDEFIDVEIG